MAGRCGIVCAGSVCWVFVAVGAVGADRLDLPIIKKDVQTGFSNAGWKYDRYKDLKSLDAHTSITVADIKGPAVITHIHTLRHNPADQLARGAVIEITFDNAPEPAVSCPLADFFGDGCNGKSMYFSTPLIECAPWSYNCYFPMPFKRRARVVLRNDTNQNTMNYSYVEWEPLPEWKPELGYFHATFQRKAFQLSKDTDETFFHITGTGHLIGRQYSIVTAEPLFRDFGFIMEGNNEVDIDGRERAIDYLGTEDSFTFSWGFQNTFIGLRVGMPLVNKGDPHQLSIYRFHDHMPIRFQKELRWHINWQHEVMFTGRPEWAKAVADGGCWVDYATVYYWYQDVPGGYQHAPLPPVDQRMKAALGPAAEPPDLTAILAKLDVDPQLELTFSTQDDLKRVRIINCYPGTHPFWIDQPQPKGGHPGQPNPGRRGILAVHPRDENTPCLVLRKVAIPAGKKPMLRIVVSGDPYEAPGVSDFLLQVGIHDGKEVKWLKEEAIDAGTPPSEKNWRTLEYPLGDYAGKTVGIVLKISYGGPKNAKMNEEGFVDEVSVMAGK